MQQSALAYAALRARTPREFVHDVRLHAFDIEARVGHDPSLDAKLRAISETPTKVCEAHP